MKFNNETKIGILVVAVLCLLAYLTVRTKDFNFSEKGYEMKAHFLNVDGVDIDAPVMLNGFEVGHVKDIQIIYEDQTIMELTLWIKEEAKIRQGAKAYVKNMGLLGEKYVGITAGDKNATFLTAGSVIQGQEPANLDKILSDGEVLAANLKEISQQVNERLKINNQSVDEIIANFKKVSGNMVSITDNVNERLTLNKTSIDDLIANLTTATQNLVELSYDLKMHPWKLMYKSKNREQKSQTPPTTQP